jgi:RimJ/RimL family protein N-acetyltransferase
MGDAHEFGIFLTSGEFVGGCGLNQISRLNKLCNLGYWVRQSRQRAGAATAATLALRDLAFASLGLARVELVVAVGNDASVAVANKVGATQECVAEHRLQLHGKATAAHVFSFINSASA